jgi:hypothetical protein
MSRKLLTNRNVARDIAPYILINHGGHLVLLVREGVTFKGYRFKYFLDQVIVSLGYYRLEKTNKIKSKWTFIPFSIFDALHMIPDITDSKVTSPLPSKSSSIPKKKRKKKVGKKSGSEGKQNPKIGHPSTPEFIIRLREKCIRCDLLVNNSTYK